MHLTIRHLTAYRYSQPVQFGEHRMMFRPRASHDLRLLRSELTISPRPQSVRWLHDVFDNSIAVATFSAPAAALRFDSAVSLEHIETALSDYPLEDYARTYPFRYDSDEWPDLAPGLSHQESDDVDAWASQFLRASETMETMRFLRSITAAIKDGFGYEPRDEKGIQSPSETLWRGRGTCRDFAVLMMAAVRSLGLAARFVSGYIFTPGLEPSGVTGAGATHAWMQVYLPGAGWVDLDPTNNIVGNRNLIRVAVAWDPKHIVPLWGTFIGYPSSFLGMDVAISVTEDSHALNAA
jgi:transglutaminase-like putative cysteine protease